MSWVSCHQHFLSSLDLPLCGACAEKTWHWRAGLSIRASSLLGSACIIWTCDFWRNIVLFPATPIGCVKLIQISIPNPRCAPPARRRMLSAVLIPGGLLVSWSPMMLSLKVRICSRRYCTLPAYPSGPTKRDPMLAVAKLTEICAGLLAHFDDSLAFSSLLKGNLGGEMSNPDLVSGGKPAFLSNIIQIKGRKCPHFLRSTCCRCSLCPWAASVFAKKSASSFHTSPACPATCSMTRSSSARPAARAWKMLRNCTNVGWLSWQLVLPEAWLAVVLESVLKTVGTVEFWLNRQSPAHKRPSLSTNSDPMASVPRKCGSVDSYKTGWECHPRNVILDGPASLP